MLIVVTSVLSGVVTAQQDGSPGSKAEWKLAANTQRGYFRATLCQQLDVQALSRLKAKPQDRLRVAPLHDAEAA